MNQTKTYEFNWKEYLRLCTKFDKNNYFTDDNLEEATTRTAISRAYYSAFQYSYFYIVKKFAYQYPSYIPTNNKQKGMHEDFFYFVTHVLFSKLSDPEDKALFKNLGIDLKTLKLLREKADYKENLLGNRMYKEVNRSISLATNIHTIIDKIKEKYPI